MKLDGQAIRIEAESKAFAGKFVVADGLGFYAFGMKITNRLFHILHGKGQMAQAASLRIGGPRRAVWLIKQFQFAAAELKIQFAVLLIRANVFTENGKP